MVGTNFHKHCSNKIVLLYEQFEQLILNGFFGNFIFFIYYCHNYTSQYYDNYRYHYNDNNFYFFIQTVRNPSRSLLQEINFYGFIRVCVTRVFDSRKIYRTTIFSGISEGRALYNLGNVYHAKGKQAGKVGHQDPGEFSEDVRQCLQQAVCYYE